LLSAVGAAPSLCATAMRIDGEGDTLYWEMSDMSGEIPLIMHACRRRSRSPVTAARDVVGPGLSFALRRFPNLQLAKESSLP